MQAITVPHWVPLFLLPVLGLIPLCAAEESYSMNKSVPCCLSLKTQQEMQLGVLNTLLPLVLSALPPSPL